MLALPPLLMSSAFPLPFLAGYSQLSGWVSKSGKVRI
jgi:hypothetical protein